MQVSFGLHDGDERAVRMYDRAIFLERAAQLRLISAAQGSSRV